MWRFLSFLTLPLCRRWPMHVVRRSCIGPQRPCIRGEAWSGCTPGGSRTCCELILRTCSRRAGAGHAQKKSTRPTLWPFPQSRNMVSHGNNETTHNHHPRGRARAYVFAREHESMLGVGPRPFGGQSIVILNSLGTNEIVTPKKKDTAPRYRRHISSVVRDDHASSCATHAAAGSCM